MKKFCEQNEADALICLNAMFFMVGDNPGDLEPVSIVAYFGVWSFDWVKVPILPVSLPIRIDDGCVL